MADLVALLGNISTSFCEHPLYLVFLASVPLISSSSEKVCSIGNLYSQSFLLLLCVLWAIYNEAYVMCHSFHGLTLCFLLIFLFVSLF